VEDLEVGGDALDLLRIRDVAKMLKISERQTWRLIHSDEIDWIRVGAQGVRVERPALAAYLKKQRDRRAVQRAEQAAS
jgi:excisionase family DNA binding protein